MASTTASDDKDFFLPDLCQGQSILFLVIVTELLVFAHVLAGSALLDFSWATLGLVSLFAQWVVLFSAALEGTGGAPLAHSGAAKQDSAALPV